MRVFIKFEFTDPDESIIKFAYSKYWLCIIIITIWLQMIGHYKKIKLLKIDENIE